MPHTAGGANTTIVTTIIHLVPGIYTITEGNRTPSDKRDLAVPPLGPGPSLAQGGFHSGKSFTISVGVIGSNARGLWGATRENPPGLNGGVSSVGAKRGRREEEGALQEGNSTGKNDLDDVSKGAENAMQGQRQGERVGIGVRGRV